MSETGINKPLIRFFRTSVWGAEVSLDLNNYIACQFREGS